MKKLTTMAMWCIAALLLTQCHSRKNGPTTANEYLPAAPDYADSAQWYISNRQAKADIFYIVSTETGDYPLPDGLTGHYADTYNDSLRQPLYGEMLGVDTLVSGKLNYFSPYYRQCSLQTFLSDSLLRLRMPVATADVKRAFSHYLKHLNQGRPFILAGFSQGAIILLDLLKEMDNETFRRMIAAYVIGATIPKETAQQCPRIVAAQRADDTGVTICYNSVRNASCAMKGWEKSAIAINPVNWKTDGQPATLITETSPLIPLDKQQKDTLNVRLDTATGLLLVDGYNGTDYQLPLIGLDGNYHSREIWFYRHQLRDNMALRAGNY